MMLVFILYCHGCASSRKPPAGAAFGTDKAEEFRAKQAGETGPGFSGGPGDVPDGGMLNGGGGQAGPLGEPQSLADWSEETIDAWGPVLETLQVNVQGGGTILVNRLASEDPFTGLYQLPNGHIICTNEPLDEILATGYVETWPETEVWNDGGEERVVVVPQIVISLIPTMSQNDIEQFIQREQLYTVFSWYIPDSQTGGNRMAIFQFEYDPGMYATFDAAYSHFSALSEVGYAEPDTLGEYKLDYRPNSGSGPLIPNDLLYLTGQSRFVSELGIDYSIEVPIGPQDTGGWFSDQVVAVVDTGVYRNHEDFAFL